MFDKALEQTHEYEADAAASQSFGNSAYANLLLRLAVLKNEMPLMHNFVKSPIKERIKMLFNSKSKDMKKLIYLLAVPIVFCLVWVFSIQIVYANKISFLNQEKSGKEIVSEKVTSSIKKSKNDFANDIKKPVSVKLDTTRPKKIIKPKIISSSRVFSDIQEKIIILNDVVFEIGADKLKADSAILNNENHTIIAFKADFLSGDKDVKSERIEFNLKDGTYKTFDSSKDRLRKSFGSYNLKQEELGKEQISYSAQDSVRFSKDKSVISLYGKAKLSFKEITIDADEIIYNDKTKNGTAKNLLLTNNNGSKIKGSNAKFNLSGKIEIWQADDNVVPNKQ
ncbi:LptA/OstA family protein [Pedobacter aquatilis]|uniref:LptA/OstA family protein n=1 Tax=Pedobacter aquatilis TaxID=351343 RepID=UPI00292E69B4|nr:LptA/OstA family protein [Pedobacter aquatilis]